MVVNVEAAEKFEKGMKSKILDDDIFWIRVEKMIKMLGPMCNLITELETNKPVIHKVHSAFSNILKTVNEILPNSILTKAEEKDIFRKIRERCEHSIVDNHNAAALLNPSEKGLHLSPVSFIFNSQ